MNLYDVAIRVNGKTVPYPRPDPDRVMGQCVQLIRYLHKYYFDCPAWPKVRGASDWWSYHNRSIIEGSGWWYAIPAERYVVPEEEDIVIWDTSKGKGYGHVGFVYGTGRFAPTAREFLVLSQNYSLPLRCTLDRFNSYGHVLGYYRFIE